MSTSMYFFNLSLRRLQGGVCSSRHHRGAALLRQEALWLRLPSRHGRPHEPHRTHVLPGPWRHGHHRLHAAVLQVARRKRHELFKPCKRERNALSLEQFRLWCSGSGWISPSTLWSTTPTATPRPPSPQSKTLSVTAGLGKHFALL